MPKQIATATREGIRKKGRECNRKRDGVEEDLNIMGIKNRQAMARAPHEWKKIVLEVKVHNGL